MLARARTQLLTQAPWAALLSLLVPALLHAQAVEYSDSYATRLTIHRVGSYAILPLFGAQYLLGNELIGGTDKDWVKPAHVGVALGVGTVFASNTVTGVWNLWEGRRDPEGRTRRLLHAGLMLAGQAGFVYTATLADDARRTSAAAERHRNAALVSIGISTSGVLLMWLWPD